MPVNFGKELKTKMSQEFGKNNPGGAEYMRDADSLLSKIKEVDDIEKPKKKKSENKEATGSGSAGGYSMPLFSTTKKEMEDEVKKVEAKEATGSGSAGSYVTPAAWAKSTNKKDWRGKSKTQIPGGKFVQVKKKCKKFPYCNQGDINALKLTDARLMDEAVKNVAKRLNVSESLIKTILNKKIINESLNRITKEEALEKGMFGPVYHGSTQEGLKKIEDIGFKFDIGDERQGDIRHGYLNVPYYPGGPPAPVHHLGYGVYFTTVKAIAKQFNQETTKGLKEYYLDVKNIAKINFASPKRMMDWWISNGYDLDKTNGNRVEATKLLTDNLKSKYDAVWFKGKGIRRLLDGDQIVVFDPSKIYRIEAPKEVGKFIGSKVIFVEDKYDYNGSIVAPKGMTGIIVYKEPAQPMRDTWYRTDVEHWTGDSEYAYDVKLKKGGTVYGILDKHIEPYERGKKID